MQALLDQGMRDGAVGFSTSQLDVHADHEGKPVPSNLATADEIVALASVLAGYPEGIMEHLCQTLCRRLRPGGPGPDAGHGRRFWRQAIACQPTAPFHQSTRRLADCIEVLEGYARDGLRVYPMASANPKGLHIALADTGMLDEMPTFRSALTGDLAQRMAVLRRPDVRDALRREFDDPDQLRQLAFGWSQLRVVGVRDAAHQRWVGQTVADIAGRAWTRRAGHVCRPVARRGPRDGVCDRPAGDPRGPRRYRHPPRTPADDVPVRATEALM